MKHVLRILLTLLLLFIVTVSLANAAPPVADGLPGEEVVLEECGPGGL